MWITWCDHHAIESEFKQRNPNVSKNPYSQISIEGKKFDRTLYWIVLNRKCWRKHWHFFKGAGEQTKNAKRYNMGSQFRRYSSAWQDVLWVGSPGNSILIPATQRSFDANYIGYLRGEKKTNPCGTREGCCWAGVWNSYALASITKLIFLSTFWYTYVSAL